ncbi:putative transposase [Staphylococcus schweitzeri]|uniref:Putative transposase n=1 Tax=Staphylococcus schweitzeri TaxID=1654388 RepID=A0A077UJM0_9STAP|nr:putative transposase [Staphylococcus schweitzeri]
MTRERRSFSSEFKLQMVRLYEMVSLGMKLYASMI